MKLGAIAVPLNTRFKSEELAYEINDAESKVLIVDEEYWPHIEPVSRELNTIEEIFFNGPVTPQGTRPFHELKAYNEDKFQLTELKETDNALILYTSGTTGRPKGAILHHRGLIAIAMQVFDFQVFEPGDKLICCVPLFHVTGIAMIMLSNIFAGIPCVYMRTFSTKELLETISSEKVTQMISVVNILWLMVNHPDFDKYDLSSFQKAACGGSPATDEMITGIMSKLPHLKLSPGYGLTECHGMVSCVPWGEALGKVKSIGKLLPLGDAKIADEGGNELPTGVIGEILLKSAKITKGYWKNPEATRTAIVDGWLRTGDIGKFDDEGYLYLLDRKKDMINRGGEKVYSLEVENAISRLNKVMEVAVVGVPDNVMGEVVKAAIVLRPGEEATEEEIKDFCSKHLADYKTPEYVEFMEDLPRNPAGKVIKDKLRE
jgi:acyl-CoA synthetase (AMP-forming)/AMP-acid ligase II